MTWYETFVWLHITAAAIWLGGDVMIQAFAYRILRTDDPARLAAFSRDVEWTGLRLIMPASVVLLASGIGLVTNGNWSWGEPFVSVGLVVWLLSFAVGAGFLGPESARIARIVEAEGPTSPGAAGRIRRILLYSRIELALLLVVVFMMAVKLGT